MSLLWTPSDTLEYYRLKGNKKMDYGQAVQVREKKKQDARTVGG